MDFPVSADHKIKLKKSKRGISTYTLLENKKKQTMEHESDSDTIVIGTIGIVTNGLGKWLEELKIIRKVEKIQTTEWLISARILSRVLETWRDIP